MDRYIQNLPRKRMSAGVIILNEAGELLILKPGYRDDWLVPGGVVEANEAPRQAALREVEEEIGLRFDTIEFVAVDYGRNSIGTDESLQFVFRVPPLSPCEANRIVLSEEHTEARFLAMSEALALLAPRLGQRFRLILEEGHSGYLET